MSLPDFSTQSSLFSTAALSGHLFAETDRYRLFGQVMYAKLVAVRPKLVACYCAENGRVAIEPVLMLGTSLLQFIDGVTDRGAVEMLRYHAGWNFALNRQLGDEVFHPSSLANFRQRLTEHDLSALGFEAIIQGLVEAGLVARRSRQRLDSLQIFAHISRMSRLECVRETLRLALEELETTASPWPRPEFWKPMWERYVQNKLDFRAEASVLQEKMQQAGLEAAQLLDWVRQLEKPEPLQGEQVQLLQRVWNENFELKEGQTQPREAQPAGAVHNPHDPEAQWAAKGQGKNRKEHVGYKVQVAETVVEGPLEKGEPTRNFITAIATQPAIGSDDAGLPLVEAEQAAMGLEKPSTWYVDGAYVSAQGLAQAQSEGRELIGPAQPSPKKEGRFSVEDFQLHVEERKGVCPAGKENTQCSRLVEETTGKVSYRFEWSTHCHDCPLRGQCLGKGQTHRSVVVGQHHTLLQARRQEQRSKEFKDKAKARNAIEGTGSELVRGHGLRRARYRGLAKMRLQNYLIGAACNIKRWISRLIWLAKQAARQSASAVVAVAS
jgi:transposase